MTYFDRALHDQSFVPNLELPAYHIDFEGGSAVNLKKTGLYRYAEDESTHLWCMAYGKDPDNIKLWTPDQPFPAELIAHAMEGGVFKAHNAMFERIIWNIVLVRRMGLPIPELQPEQMNCTMVRAYAKALPGALDEVAKFLALAEQKDLAGAAIMKKMMKPRKARKGEDPNVLHWWDTPENLAILYEYCKQDVRTEMAVDHALAELAPEEFAIWCLDQRINDRGVEIDITAAARAEKLILQVKADLDRQMAEVTGQDMKCSQVAVLTDFLTDRGYDVSDGLAKDRAKEMSVNAKAADDFVATEALRLRSEYAKSSTAKINAMLNSSCADLRSRGNFQHHGASTGRWAGRLIQLQNLPRTKSQERAMMLIDLLASSNLADADLAEAIGMVFGQPIVEVSNALRAMIRAKRKHIFIQRDFSNIEGRVNAWLSDEMWKIQAFRDYDAGRGFDLYLIGAGRLLGKLPTEISSDERQAWGKVPELALGYQGGVGAFQSMARIYGIEIEDTRAEEIKVAWRKANPMITKSWWEYQDAVIEAVSNPGRVVECRGGRVRYLVSGGFLYCRLPSGRCLSYARPRIEHGVDGFGRTRREVRCEGYKISKASGQRMWVTDINLYGGILCENIVQAIARDVLVSAMWRVEARGWPIVMHVHDELVLEVPLEIYEALDLSEVDREMNTLPAWAEGLPMAVGGWEGDRYRKD